MWHMAEEVSANNGAVLGVVENNRHFCCVLSGREVKGRVRSRTLLNAAVPTELQKSYTERKDAASWTIAFVAQSPASRKKPSKHFRKLARVCLALASCMCACMHVDPNLQPASRNEEGAPCLHVIANSRKPSASVDRPNFGFTSDPWSVDHRARQYAHARHRRSTPRLWWSFWSPSLWPRWC